ncbi:hypothetical protein M011DRAFT_423197, partial [Sporormia fimetaria CBS 119925]
MMGFATTSPVLNFVLRGTQILFAIVIIGLSVDLIRGHKVGSLPNSLGFSAFVGGLSILAGILGLAATWIDGLNSLVGVGIDAIVALVNIAGGILLATKVGGANCGQKTDDNWYKLSRIDILNGGCDKNLKDEEVCWYWHDSGANFAKMNTRCHQSKADFVFMFLVAAALIASALITYLRVRR